MNTTGLSRKDLSKCSLCGEGVLHDGSVCFYRVNVAQAIIDVSAVQRTHGLEMMMGGNAALADVFSPDQDLAQEITSPTVNVCASCMMSPDPMQLMSILQVSQDEGK